MLSALLFSCGGGNNNQTAQTTEIAETKAHDCTKCESKENCLLGKWVRPISGQEGQVEGFEFKENGIAQPINMSTLQVEKWSIDSTTLTISGKSIGNGQTIDFTDSYTIANSDAKSLNLLKDGEVVWALSKE